MAINQKEIEEVVSSVLDREGRVLASELTDGNESGGVGNGVRIIYSLTNSMEERHSFELREAEIDESGKEELESLIASKINEANQINDNIA